MIIHTLNPYPRQIEDVFKDYFLTSPVLYADFMKQMPIFIVYKHC